MKITQLTFMFYQLPELLKFPKLIHGFSVKEAGNMSFRWDKVGEVKENRQKFFNLLNITSTRVVTAELEHQDTVIRVSDKDAGLGVLDNNYQLKADGLITNEPGLFLFHVVADCLSLLFYDPQNQAIGLAHAGWRNAAKVITAMVHKMDKEFTSNIPKLTVALGPAIHNCCYAYPKHETGDLPEWKDYLTPDTQGLIHIDLIKFAVDQLRVASISDKNIIISPECTAHSDKFFSHYRSQRHHIPEARFTAIIGLKA